MISQTRINTNNKMVRSVCVFLVCLGLCLLPILVSSLFVGQYPDEWYESLKKPSFNPPSWVFGVVWPILYLLMAVSLATILLLKTTSKIRYAALAGFFTQLLLNAAWTPIFFRLHLIRLALADIVLIIAIVIFTISLFYRISKIAALLLIPYLAWLGFALTLNTALLILN